MKHRHAPIPALLTTLIMLTSCIMTTVVKEMEDTIMNVEGHYISKATTLPMGTLLLEIQNNAENTILQIDSMAICNIQLQDSTGKLAHNVPLSLINTPLQLQYGANTAITSENIPAQTLTPWAPDTLPILSKNTYAKIHGTIYTHITNNTLFTIYTGTMYYPISGTIPTGSTAPTPQHNIPLTINIYPNSPLYAILNGIPTKILQPITFTVTITDWQ